MWTAYICTQERDPELAQDQPCYMTLRLNEKAARKHVR